MSFVRQFAVLALTLGSGFFLAACEPGTATAPGLKTVASIAVTPATATLAEGATQALSVVATFSDNSSQDVTASGTTFGSSATSVATVSASGVVTGVKAGAATITATNLASGKTATASITVTPGALVSIAVTPAAPNVAPGGTAALSVLATYADASTAPVTAGLTYASSDATVVSVDAAGVVTGVKTGSATVTVTETASGKTSAVVVTVGSTYPVLDFNTAGVTYGLTPFGGGAASLTSSGFPAGGPANTVMQFVKTAGAACYAGVTMSVGAANSIGRLPFSASATVMTVRMYVPVAGVVIKLKVEDANNAGVTAEVDVVPSTTGWQTLSFDFAHPAAGTPALDPTKTYNKISLFGDFTCVTNAPAPSTDEVFYVGPITFVGAAGPSAPPLLPSYAVLDFNTTGVSYAFAPFGGAVTGLTNAGVPAGGPTNQVLKFVKTAGAACYAGATMSVGYNFSVGAMPFTAAAHVITVPMYVPVAGVVIKLKVEDASNNAITLETDVVPNATGWQTLSFDFSHPSAGTPALDSTKTYNKISLFADFTCVTNAPAPGADEVFYAGPFTFVGAAAPSAPPLSPPVSAGAFATITFDDASKTYPTSDFAGAVSSVGAGPTGSNGNVLKVIKTAGAALYAGSLVGDQGNASAPQVGAVPFTSARTKFTVRVWAAAAGLDIKLKLQDATGGIHVETDVPTTVAGGWSTLTFDLAANTAGTPALDLTQTYQTLVLFADFGSTPSTDEAPVYFDDITFLP